MGLLLVQCIPIVLTVPAVGEENMFSEFFGYFLVGSMAMASPSMRAEVGAHASQEGPLKVYMMEDTRMGDDDDCDGIANGVDRFFDEGLCDSGFPIPNVDTAPWDGLPFQDLEPGWVDASSHCGGCGVAVAPLHSWVVLCVCLGVLFRRGQDIDGRTVRHLGGRHG